MASMSGQGSFSTEMGFPRHVRFTPGSDRIADMAGGPVRANSRHCTLGLKRKRPPTEAAYRIKKPGFKERGFLGSCCFIYGQSGAGCRGGLRLGRIARIAVIIVRAIYFGLAYRRQ